MSNEGVTRTKNPVAVENGRKGGLTRARNMRLRKRELAAQEIDASRRSRNAAGAAQGSGMSTKERIEKLECPMCDLRERHAVLHTAFADLQRQYDESAANYEELRKRLGRLVSDVHEVEGLGTLAAGQEGPVPAPTRKSTVPQGVSIPRKRRYHRRLNEKTAKGSFWNAQHVIQGRKLCSLCHKVFPANPRFFYQLRRSHTGLDSACRKCTNRRNETYKTTVSSSTPTVLRRHSVDAGMPKVGLDT